MIHRLEFRHGDKGYVVRAGNRLTIAGLIVLAAAMTCAITLVTGFLFGTAMAIATAAFAVFAFAMVWFVVPLWRRRAVAPGRRFLNKVSFGSRAGRVAHGHVPRACEEPALIGISYKFLTDLRRAGRSIDVVPNRATKE